MPGTLFVVATPIGNLEDITLRAIRVLGEAALIAAEDTRRTRTLLRHFDIATPTTSLYAQNESRKIPGLVDRLTSGADIALVTDAGTPTVSDPGARLVAAARAAGIAVSPVPGASAILAALSASGFPASRFRFEGFAPRKKGERRAWLERLAAEPEPIVFFEAPHRADQTLQELQQNLGNRQIIIGRELTKLHEELVELPKISGVNDKQFSRGELTIVIGPAKKALKQEEITDARSVGRQFDYLTKIEGLDRRAAVKRLAKELGMGARSVYALVETVKD